MLYFDLQELTHNKQDIKRHCTSKKTQKPYSGNRMS